MHAKRYVFGILLGLGLFLQSPRLCADAKDSVINIKVHAQSYRFNMPWKKSRVASGIGTGFLISGNRIITNAHVVSDARYIEVRKLGDDQKYPAVVSHIAHDCDLAMLQVDNPAFFDGMKALEFGTLPEIDSMVTTYGFPLGGQQVSVTRGVVSRIEHLTYSHSAVDSHLVIQTDAAINPGNSGGPVMQEDMVVGVAFQGISRADNIGYLIPVTVIRHFLEDIEDGTLHGFGNIGIQVRHDCQNPIIKELLGMPEERSGTVVIRVFPNMPACDVLEPMDVILAIGEYDIKDDGMIQIDGRKVPFDEVIEREQIGTEITFTVWRDKKELTVTIPVAKWKTSIDRRNPFDIDPRYYIFGGLCFTPLSRGYIMAAGGWSSVPIFAKQLFVNAHGDPVLSTYKEFPVLCKRLPDGINANMDGFVGHIVDRVNGVAVTSLDALKKALEEAAEDIVSIEFLGNKVPLMISKQDAMEKGSAILQKYRVPEGERL